MAKASGGRVNRVYVGVHVSNDLYEQIVKRQKELNETADRYVSISEVVRKVLRVEFPQPNTQQSK